MKPKPLLLSLAALLVAAAAGSAWWFQGASEQQSRVAAVLPPPPDLSAAPAPMRAALAAAAERAHSLRHARDGFAELVQLYHANGFLDAALHGYAGLAALEPDQPRWPHFHASILAGYGDVEPAIALWQRVVALAPDYLPARLRLGDSLLKNNQLDEAAATYTAVLERAPGDAYAQLGLARIDLEAERWNQARERLETIVRATNYELGYDLIVSLYERLGETDRALAIRGSAKALGSFRDPPDPWVDALIDLCYDPYRISLAAGVAGRTGDSARGRALLERAIELAPGDVSTRFQLGTLALQQGDTATARDQFERCTILAPDFSDAWAQLSALQARLGDPAGAARTLATGLRHCPESPGLHLMQARTFRQAGRIEEAINEFMVSINLRPNEPEAFIELGSMLVSVGRTDEGIEQLRRSLDTDPANPVALSILAFHAISTGDEAETDRWMSRIADQPRVTREQSSRLHAAYRQQFGREWQPKR